jgi:hypothetical protein
MAREALIKYYKNVWTFRKEGLYIHKDRERQQLLKFYKGL